jgi:hypothetical protein
MRDTVQWTTPSPLWETAISRSSAVLRREELNRPSILRFATDTFMDDFMQMLANDPKRLAQYIALPETWRGISPPPEPLKPAPAFARNIQRLGLVAAQKKEKSDGLTQTSNQFTQFSNNAADEPLKLYQPAHQRFYLISACLVCERPGLPDKALSSEREEKVSFVIRRLFPPGALNVDEKLPLVDSGWQEYAFVLTPQGAKWQKVESQNALIEGEEPQSLFAVNFNEDDGRKRKIFAGVIPAGRREAYMAAGNSATDGASGVSGNVPPDSRTIVMRSQFRDPWKSLLQTAQHTQEALNESYDGDAQPISVKTNLLKGSREQIQTVSWLILLDFANFLAKNLPRVWASLNGVSVSPGLNQNENNLVQAIAKTTLAANFAADLVNNFPNPSIYSASQVKRSLLAALLAVKPANEISAAQIENNLESVVISYNRLAPDPLYPNFLFPLADPQFSLQTVLDGSAVSITPTVFSPENITGENAVNRIAQLVEAALPAAPQNVPPQPAPLASQTPMDMREGWFVIRCVYERPLCGAIDPPVLSAPTKPFQIAGFFDPDAPARPIRISLPLDPTPAGLRKFDKNAVFMMSDLLCGQVSRMKGITFGDLIRSALPFPLHKDLSVPDAGGCKKSDGVSIGMMCSLSIPIITICALILLMIIVGLLDFIFRWLPFFITCFPLPGLKAKK